ncbi:hypothetical protein M5K25_024217 [Dendrobium thyrsiflorum]|uniref:Uncharacterized protein n=1 Tax=Dendrobium thyrsiflorum TaxID=117978 RepID=A0ABD0U1A7_DENTH
MRTDDVLLYVISTKGKVCSLQEGYRMEWRYQPEKLSVGPLFVNLERFLPRKVAVVGFHGKQSVESKTSKESEPSITITRFRKRKQLGVPYPSPPRNPSLFSNESVADGNKKTKPPSFTASAGPLIPPTTSSSSYRPTAHPSLSATGRSSLPSYRLTALHQSSGEWASFPQSLPRFCTLAASGGHPSGLHLVVGGGSETLTCSEAVYVCSFLNGRIFPFLFHY